MPAILSFQMNTLKQESVPEPIDQREEVRRRPHENT